MRSQGKVDLSESADSSSSSFSSSSSSSSSDTEVIKGAAGENRKSSVKQKGAYTQHSKFASRTKYKAKCEVYDEEEGLDESDRATLNEIYNNVTIEFSVALSRVRKLCHSVLTFNEYSGLFSSKAPKYALICLVIGLLLALYVYRSLLFAQSIDLRLQDFIRDADSEASRFGEYPKVRAMLRYAGGILIKKQSKSPVVFLMAGNESKTKSLLASLRQLLSKHGLYSNSLEGQNQKSRDEFANEVFSLLHRNRVLFICNIDKLGSTSPLVLQSVSDPESSPFKDILIVGTLVPSGQGSCHERINDHLLNTWGNGLSVDKIFPIISRLSAILLCFD